MVQQQVVATRLATAILRLLPAVNSLLNAHLVDAASTALGSVRVTVRALGWPLPRWI